MDNIYKERAHLLALLSRHYPSGFSPGADPEYPDWPILFINFPTGQATWHISPDDVSLFNHVPVTWEDEWDGHTTEEKYRRIQNLTDNFES